MLGKAAKTAITVRSLDDPWIRVNKLWQALPKQLFFQLTHCNRYRIHQIIFLCFSNSQICCHDTLPVWNLQSEEKNKNHKTHPHITTILNIEKQEARSLKTTLQKSRNLSDTFQLYRRQPVSLCCQKLFAQGGTKDRVNPNYRMVKKVFSVVFLTYCAFKPYQENLASLFWEVASVFFLHQGTVFQLPVCKNWYTDARKVADDQNWWLSRKRWIVIWLDQKDGMTLQMWFSSGINKNAWKESSAVIKRSQLKRRKESQATLRRHRLHNLPTSLKKAFQKYTVEYIFYFRKQTWQLKTVRHQRCWVKPYVRPMLG